MRKNDPVPDFTLRLDESDVVVTVPAATPRAAGASRGASGGESLVNSFGGFSGEVSELAEGARLEIA